MTWICFLCTSNSSTQPPPPNLDPLVLRSFLKFLHLDTENGPLERSLSQTRFCSLCQTLLQNLRRKLDQFQTLRKELMETREQLLEVVKHGLGIDADDIAERHWELPNKKKRNSGQENDEPPILSPIFPDYEEDMDDSEEEGEEHLSINMETDGNGSNIEYEDLMETLEPDSSAELEGDEESLESFQESSVNSSEFSECSEIAQTKSKKAVPAAKSSDISKDKDSKMFQCSFCPKSYKERGGVNKHYRNHHPGLQPPEYVCQNCGTGFPLHRKLLAHYSTNCQKKTKALAPVPAQLSPAKLNSDLEGKHKSSVFGRQYTNPISLARPRRVSNRGKFPEAAQLKLPPRKTASMGSNFAVAGAPKKHRCTFCPSGFSREYDLLRHFKDKHKDKESSTVPGAGAEGSSSTEDKVTVTENEASVCKDIGEADDAGAIKLTTGAGETESAIDIADILGEEDEEY